MVDVPERVYPTISELRNYKKVYNKEQEIGIEIEVEGRNLNLIPANRVWKTTQDGSLRGYESAEYILHHPIPIQNVEKEITRLINMLKKVKAKKELSDRCGVHIHMNVQHMTFNELMNYICLYLVLEPLLVSYCGDSREGNMFCLRAKDAEALIDVLIAARVKSDLHTLISGGNIYRYAAMNVSSISKHGSLEFRSLKTPRNFKDIVTWVHILHKIKTSSFKFETPENVIDAYSMYDYHTFLYRIFGDYARYLLDLDDINRKLLQGIRIAQDVAYTEVKIPPITIDKLKKNNSEKTIMWTQPNPGGLVFYEDIRGVEVPMPHAVLPNTNMVQGPPPLPEEPVLPPLPEGPEWRHVNQILNVDLEPRTINTVVQDHEFIANSIAFYGDTEEQARLRLRELRLNERETMPRLRRRVRLGEEEE